MRDAHAPHADALPRELDTRPKPPPSLSPTGVSRDPLSPRPPKNRDPVFIQSHKKRKKATCQVAKRLFFSTAQNARRAGEKQKAQFPGRGAMPRATKAWSAGSNLRARLFGGRAALRARAEKPGRRRHQGRVRAGAEMSPGGRFVRASVGNGGRVARPPTADEDTDYETASEGDAEAMAEALLSVQDGEDDARDDDAWIRAGGSDRLEEVPSTSRRASFDASLPRASRVRGAGSAGRVRGALVRGRGDHGLAQGARAGVPPA